MKKFILLMLILANVNSYGVDSLAFKLTFQDEMGGKNQMLHFGIHKNATDTIDFEIGEVVAPPFPPPDELYAVFLITDSSTYELFHSYFDFRPIPEQKQFYKYYKFRLFNLGTAYTISWQKMNKYIDSAFIIDIFTGKIVNVNMMTQESHRVENFSQNQFNILVYYNLNSTDVEEKELFAENEFVYPNPSSERIYIKNKTNTQYLSYIVVNELGNEVGSGLFSEDRAVDIDNLSLGTYYLTLYDGQGYIKRYRFIKI